jgi:hypothetical protein
MNRQSIPVPEAIARLQRQLEQIRSSQPPRSRLPEPLWGAAVELARQHGIYQVAHTLRLDYMGLKKRLNGMPRERRKRRKTGFVELVAPPPTVMPECVIEFESANGAKMRIEWKAAAPPDWASCCVLGGKRWDDSDHATDARAGRHRADRWTQGH